jgi:hypothetical protein
MLGGVMAGSNGARNREDMFIKGNVSIQFPLMLTGLSSSFP